MKLVKLLIIFLILGLMYAGWAYWTGKAKEQRTEIDKMKLNQNEVFHSITDKGSLMLYARYQWDAKNGFPSILIPAPQSAVFPADTTFLHEKIRADVRVRVAPGADGLLIASGDFLFKFLHAAQVECSFFIPGPPTAYDWRQLIDFSSDPELNFFFLERLGAKNKIVNRLLKMSKEGKLLWEKTGSQDDGSFDLASLTGSYKGFLADKSNLYLYGVNQQTMEIAKVEKNSGQLTPYHRIAHLVDTCCMDEAGRVYYLRYLKEKNLVYFIQYDPASQKELSFACNQEMYGLLKFLMGCDNEGRGYVRYGMAAGCIDGQNNTVWKMDIDNMVIDPGAGELYLSKNLITNSGSLMVAKKYQRKTGPGDLLLLEIPRKYVPEAKGWRLVRVENGYVYVRGDQKSGARVLLKFKSTGEFVKAAQLELGQNDQADFPTKHEFKLQPPSTWGIDQAGNLYLPIHGPEYLYIYMVSFDK